MTGMSLPQFRMALKNLGVQAEDASSIFEAIDEESIGEVDMQELVQILAAPPGQHDVLGHSSRYIAANTGDRHGEQRRSLIANSGQLEDDNAQRKIAALWDVIGNRVR